MSELFDRLQATLGKESYLLERELGGGGMSQVFLATDVALGRKVVVKVLPPEMAAGVNKERFQREIKLAASLQHPHVVQLLSAGSEGDLLWYIMPYIEGESLRVKLAREGELPIAETMQILSEVMDALAYAHESEVVHRDIKPDNVMISRGHALVVDFGVAKAVSMSSGGTSSSLTSLGVALGTPAYMSPEQAAADPHVDHRADIYAVGALAYEMLTGRPPFVKQTPQQVLAAHVTEQPDQVTTHRNTIPVGIADIVMRCLAKRPADRWQTASELRAHLIAAVTPDSGGMTPTATAPYDAAATSTMGVLRVLVDTPLKLAASYLGVAAFVLLFVYALVIAFGLPDWVFMSGVGLAVIGFPIMLATARREHRVLHAQTTGMAVATPIGLEKHLTWKKAFTGGGLAFTSLAFVAAGFMAMRSAGIGPAATLMTRGVFDRQEELILADFANRTSDSTLGQTVTELARISLSQSTVVRLVDPARISQSLTRMQRPADAPVPAITALEIAERDGFKAVLAGEVAPLGQGFLLSARVLSATGVVLAAQHASAAGPDGLIGAVDELIVKLRENIGESLRAIRRTVPLDFITTGSLDALRLYTQGAMAEVAGDVERALDLLEQAVEIDSSFAMAYRKIGTILSNDNENPARAIEVTTRAYELRDHLTERERAYAVAAYHSTVTGDYESGLSAFRTLLQTHPGDHRALNNSGVLYMYIGDYQRAREFWLAGVDADSTWPIGFTNASFAQALVGDTAGARRTLDAMHERFGDNPLVTEGRGDFAYTTGDWQTALALWNDVRVDQSSSPRWQTEMYQKMGHTKITEGRLVEGLADLEHSRSALEQRGLNAASLSQSIGAASGLSYIDENSANRLAQAAIERYPLENMAVANRPYAILAEYYAKTSQLAEARAMIAKMEASGQPQMGLEYERSLRRAKGRVRVYEGDFAGGLAEYRSGTNGWPCFSCKEIDQAEFFDLAGQTDSALTYWEEFVTTGWRAARLDAGRFAAALIRSAELNSAAGNKNRAVELYSDFVDLWAKADPQLQPRVAEIRERIARLVAEN